MAEIPPLGPGRRGAWRVCLLSVLMAIPTGCKDRCRSWPTWDAVEPVVGADVPELWSDRTLAAVAEFGRWATHEEVCLASVTVSTDLVELRGGEYSGSYRWPTGEITLGDNGDWSYWDVATHELCHAGDLSHGVLDRNHEVMESELPADLVQWWNFEGFSEEELAEGTAEIPKRRRDSEYLAFVCQNGPRDVARWRWTEDECGVDYTDVNIDQLDVINDELFGGAPRIPWASPELELPEQPAWHLDLGGRAGAGARLSIGETGYEADAHGLVRLEQPLPEGAEVRVQGVRVR